MRIIFFKSLIRAICSTRDEKTTFTKVDNYPSTHAHVDFTYL